jgi:hypothetical protein
MTYVFASLDGRKRAECGEKEWKAALDSARARGMEAGRNEIDFQFQVDEVWDDRFDYTWNLKLMLEVHMMATGWDGNYTEKENQIISESDAYALFCSLDETLVSRALLELLAGGAVRICA